MIDCVLTPAQQSLRESVRSFAQAYLVPAAKKYEQIPLGSGGSKASSNGDSSESDTPKSFHPRFQSTKPVLAAATSMGLVKSLVPAALGGTAGTLVDSMLVTEELFAVEPSISLTLLGIGLGLTPIFLADFSGREDLRSEILAPFIHQGDGTTAPLAALCLSEPGGSANYFSGSGDGAQTTATYNPDTDSWIVNGEKIWGGSCSGWDDQGADLQVLFARNPAITSSKVDACMLLLLTRSVLDANRSSSSSGKASYTVLRHPTTPGFTATSGPHIRLTNLSIPSRYVLATGASAAKLLSATSTSSAVIVGAMAVGIMRAAFLSALSFARTSTAGSAAPVITHQSPADLLIGVKCRIEACRAFTWKAAAAIDAHLPGAEELAYEVKIYASEAAVSAVAEAMRVVGGRAYDQGGWEGEWREGWPFARLMADALVLPAFSGGNVGVRRRQLQRVFAAEGYEGDEAVWGASFGVPKAA